MYFGKSYNTRWQRNKVGFRPISESPIPTLVINSRLFKSFTSALIAGLLSPIFLESSAWEIVFSRLMRFINARLLASRTFSAVAHSKTTVLAIFELSYPIKTVLLTSKHRFFLT
jgi:hypothetical protein